jgi:hypothetical protein
MRDGLVVASAGGYALNATLGTLVAARVVDTSRFRWLHHALYVSTCVLTAAALAALLTAGDAPHRTARARRTAWVLAPVVAPLAAVPFVSARSPRHPLVALAAAPFFAAALVRVLLHDLEKGT